MKPTESDLRALEILGEPRTCTELGEILWDHGRRRNRQSWARPAGKVLARLVRVGWVHEHGGRRIACGYWVPRRFVRSREGDKVLAREPRKAE